MGERMRLRLDGNGASSIGAAFVLAFICIFEAGALRAQQGVPAGSVIDVQGSATAISRTDERALAPQAAVFRADSIVTATQSRVDIRLGRDTTLRLGERGRIVIEQFLASAGGDVSLASGALLVDKAPNTASRPVRIRSAFGLIAVRGTRFFAGPSRGTFGVFVVRGALDVRAAGRTVRLRPGEGTDIARPGAAPTVPKIWGAERVAEALAQFD
jgi:ferric-dicitrate binding protein FerR (iron transport regulator)